uniref:Ig-like domain-containing protein n=1 Tax=Cyprinus carpio TaxID=7962 RepID=A0A8C1NKX9_CYPCA
KDMQCKYMNTEALSYESTCATKYVIPKITALPRSCVVIPCSFKMEEEYVTRLRVLWVTKKGGYMFHTDPVDVLDNFKGRTRLLGNPDEQNCTVEMDNVQTHDNGPFCVRAERENERYSFNNSCVFIIMRASPDKPVMSSLPEDIEPGTRVTIKCSVNHTCSSHPPQITWSIPTARETISHSHMGGGVWETVSAVTFIPTGYEEKDEIVCTANFWGGKTQEKTAFLSIRIYLFIYGLFFKMRSVWNRFSRLDFTLSHLCICIFFVFFFLILRLF